MNNGKSIRKRLLTGLIVLAIGPLILLGGILSIYNFRSELEQVKSTQHELTKRALNEIGYYIHEQQTALLSLVGTNNLLAMPPKDLRELLSRFRTTLKDEHHRDIYEEISLLNSEGKELMHVSRTGVVSEEGFSDLSTSEEFKVPSRDGVTYYGPVYFDEVTGEPLMKISTPIINLYTMETNGVLVSTVKMMFIWNLIADVKTSNSSVAYLIDGNGRIVAHPNPSMVLRGVNVDVPEEVGSRIEMGLTDRRSLVSSDSMTLGAQTLYLITEVPVTSALKHPIYTVLTIGLFILFSLLLAVTLGYVLIRNLVMPIESLAGTAKGIADGDLSLKAELKRSDELGVLSDSFNNMTSRLIEMINRLKKEKSTLRAYLDTAGIMVVVIDNEGNVQLINKKGCEVLGYAEEEILGKGWFDNFLPEKLRVMDIETHLKLMAGDIEGGTHHESKIITKGGEERDIDWYNTVLRDGDGKITAMLSSGIDTTQKKQDEILLNEQSKLIKSTMESMTHPFFVIDAKDYTVKIANPACKFGPLTESSTCYKLTHKTDHPCDGIDHPCTIKEIMKTNKQVVLEHVHYREDGTPAFYEIYGYPIFNGDGEVSQVIEYNVDITERRRLEHQFLQAQKMESVGRLAGGVAHDFNNLLSAIIGYGEIVVSELPEDSPVRSKIEVIIEAGEKASVLTRQLLAFSRKQVLEMKVTSLNTIVENMLKILERTIGDDIELEVSLGSVTKVKADQTQLEQVFLNLAINARDAMPCGGTLNIETADVELDEDYAQKHPGVKPGRYSMLAFTDTGEGMNREVQAKIFEPFFSTKGKLGTGLGLSTVYGIVKQHEGHIFVYSEPKIGTTFKIYFPTTSESEKAVKEEINVGDLHGTETILVVDDEPSIRRLVADTLQPLGYRVIDAACGSEAMQICESASGEIDLVLSDVIMPSMSGGELMDAVKSLYPNIEFIFMSGYTDSVIASHGILKRGVTFIQKPLTPSRLAQKLREVLDLKGAGLNS